MASGKPTYQQQRGIYLENNPITHRVLKRWEIENYLYDKEVLSAHCVAKDFTFDETKYNRLVTNIEDQDLKSVTNQIKNICGISAPINKELFKIELSTHINQNMIVYQELEDCIFNRK